MRVARGDSRKEGSPSEGINTRKTVTVNYFEGNIVSVPYPFDSIIKVNIYEDLLINFSELADMWNI